MTDEVVSDFDEVKAGYRANLTPERLANNACEWRVVAGLRRCFPADSGSQDT
ncbi:hypothetical protein [Caballeronia sordidicola]|uniref:hypothetical protein n=1 Tax=Caballeronia sordidicola TaxID=196367 RepID=UPI001363DB85|nr:hypothetical protein [Caballeronia sordidicola]